jgi:hypothetical protein
MPPEFEIEQPLKAQEEETDDLINLKEIYNPILEDQKNMREELAHFSKIAFSSLQGSLTNQTMISTLCKSINDYPRLEEFPQPRSLTK